MDKKELTEGLEAEAKALKLTENLRKYSLDFMAWLDVMLMPFEPHGRWIMNKYNRELNK